MEKQTTPREQPPGRAGTSRTPDRWLWAGSLLFHLIVFLLLPAFSTQAKQPIQLLIEIVKPEMKRQPLKPRGVKDPRPATKSSSQPVDGQPAKLEANLVQDMAPSPAPILPEPETPMVQPDVESPILDEPQPNPSDATPTAPIPEMVAVPTYQPVAIPPPADPVEVAEKVEPTPDPVVGQPVPVEAPVQETQPTLPTPASSSGSTTTPPKPSEAEVTTPDVPIDPPAESTRRTPTGGTPAVGIPGQPDIGDAEPAGPPGPSALELGMLGDYGDGARKKIRMLVRTPELAREQGLEGKCKFEFELHSDGKLVGIKILESSSYPVLDEECLEATRVAAPFKRFPRGVSVDSWKFQMEIVFPTY